MTTSLPSSTIPIGQLMALFAFVLFYIFPFFTSVWRASCMENRSYCFCCIFGTNGVFMRGPYIRSLRTHKLISYCMGVGGWLVFFF